MNTVSEGKPIFYDEERRRWRRTRIVLEATGALFTIVLVVFFVSVIERVDLPAMLLPRSHSGLHAVLAPEKAETCSHSGAGAKRKSKRSASNRLRFRRDPSCGERQSSGQL